LLHSEGLEKRQGHRALAVFGAFRLLLGGSELCKAQETRGSKFTCEFGRNSTVFCFVASRNNVQLPLAKYEIYLTFSKSVLSLLCNSYIKAPDFYALWQIEK